MSQDYFSGGKGKGKGPAKDNSDSDDGDDKQLDHAGRPGFMTVGSGSTSRHADRLRQQLLDNDSGYGGSITGDDLGLGRYPLGSPRTDPSLAGELPVPQTGDLEGDHRNRQAALHQLWYNKHRVALGRSIQRVVELLRDLQDMNSQWPAHYPSVQRAESERPASTKSKNSRPSIQHTQTTLGDQSAPAPRPIRRSLTSLPEPSAAESSKDAENSANGGDAPRLMTPQIAQEFSILKLDLKLGSLHQAELVHSLEKGSVASLLDGKISGSIRHLLSLQERIEDTASKVLITGDLNAGKSTFCNALLRRKVLPEDQQPCTSIFCEVLDARENSGIEEVHAIHMDAVYNRNDEGTYDVYPLKELENIVVDNTRYMQCKVYVKDVRTIDESLLNNGVVDIALIDAPGLNSDTTKTTAVFARQEEIDVVVFVVSAANHFTQSAKEFIWAAAAEKAYIFMVVNGYDMIRDKERCQKLILDQVYGLSPRTFKESSELVHFVSSSAIPVAPGGPGGGGSGSSSGGGGGGGDDDDDPKGKGKGKGKEKEKLRDFEKLEQSLRRFVLEKRARSKLAPARTYLLNILNDVNVLATVNAEVAQSELDRVTKELKEIEPQLESSQRAKTEVSDQIDRVIEDNCKDVYDHTRMTLTSAIVQSGETDYGIPYPGIWGAFEYAEEIKEAIMAEISASVNSCEEYARNKTTGGVNAIKQLGQKHLGDEYQDLSFRSDVMFKRRRDALAKQIDVSTDLVDFVDFNTLLQRQEKMAGTGMALTIATAVGGRLVGGMGWMDHTLSIVKVAGNDNLRRLIVPGLVIAVISAAAYIVQQIPHSLPHRLAHKISAQLDTIDYVHVNGARISSSVRKVLRFPADNLRVGLTRSFEQLGARREETLKVRGESEVALKYFGNLVRNSARQRAAVQEVDLDAHPHASLELGSL
ncbi:transmembrane GTPase fzo1 [Microdochium trichocladiopsis]|uniref:Transmembrane GTPase fzo1 n=1 Tax=Microdochium trichocladiopsis TaxID=1682393 RepID=A0A9P8YHW8_9PEZI|nr:transmembrane GTPase fzo1 [Microdochium trichocladiopsis]KAH7038259.1 transmembrane GTPase fzo1 [Microdochium trichocladiopsis]